MNKKYIFGLVLAIVLLIANQALTQYYLLLKKGDEKQIGIAGRQRMYSQQISLEFYEYSKGKSNINEVKATYNEWKEVHYALLKGNPSKGIDKIDLDNVESILQKLSPKIEYIGEQIKTAENSRDVNLIHILENQRAFLSDMEGAVTILEEVAAKKLNKLAITEITLAVLSLIIIVLGVIIYYPVARNLTTTNVKLQAALERQKEDEREIRDLLAVKQNQNDRLKNFAHIVSHNLRSHSAGMSSLIELYELENPEMFQDEIFGYLKDASNNLVETVRHLSEIVEMTMLVTEEKVSLELKPVIEKSISSILGLASTSNVSIVNEVQAGISVLAIPAYMDSIVLNFLTNGIKYKSNDRDSYVKVSARTEDNYTVIKFEDNGLGINLEANGNKLFGMYKTFHNNEDAKGIGLFITKNQIENLEGRIEVESEENKGTIFKIYLPNG